MAERSAALSQADEAVATDKYDLEAWRFILAEAKVDISTIVSRSRSL